MSDRCYSTLVCSKRDQDMFEKIGYRLEDSTAMDVMGDEISFAIVMVDDGAPGGHYDELASLEGAPYVVCNGSCPGVFGDHLLASDGKEWSYSEALHESNYPAVRVDPDGTVKWSEVNEATKYWSAYRGAVAALKARGGEIVPPGARTEGAAK